MRLNDREVVAIACVMIARFEPRETGATERVYLFVELVYGECGGRSSIRDGLIRLSVGTGYSFEPNRLVDRGARL